MLVCQYCSRECKNANSLRNHERLCKNNPDRQSTPFMDGKQDGHKPSNQFIKAKENGVEYIVSEETRQKLSNAVKNRSDEFNKELGKKISATINSKVEEGTWHTSLAKHIHYEYNGVDLHGSWEVAYAQFLDKNGVKWVRNKDHFEYFFDGKIRRYTPDFYLPDTDEYIEIKGFKTEKDEAKWAYFPKNKTLRILMRCDLKELNII